MSPQASVQLRLIAEIVDVAHRIAIPVWLRGGWAMDFYLGRVTREHRDVDWFVDVAQADRLDLSDIAILEAAIEADRPDQRTSRPLAWAPPCPRTRTRALSKSSARWWSPSASRPR